MVAVPGLTRHRVDGGEVAALTLGAAVGPTLVLIPGLTDGLAPVTDPAARALFTAAPLPLPLERMRGLVLSHRMPLPPGTSTAELAADLAAVLATRLEEPAVLVAHSLGGMVAQHLAATHPEVVAGLVLSATMGRADDRLRAVLARWDRWLIRGDQARFRRDAIHASLTGAACRDALALDTATAVRPAPPSRVARHLVLSAATAGHDATADLHRVRVPALVLAGSEDELVDPAAAAALAAALPAGHLVGFDGLGHGFPEQAPGPFRHQVVGFLAGLGW